MTIILASTTARADTVYVNRACGDNNWTGLSPTCQSPDGPKKSIRAAINVAVDGDTIIVADGLYRGAGNRNLSFAGLRITLRSAGGPLNCIIDCRQINRFIRIDRNETADTVLDGFTVRNGLRNAGMPGTPDGGAILCNGASPSILNCIFIDNSADLGGAVNVVDGNPTFTNCAFIRNSATGNGGGMNNDNSGPILTNCTFADNAASSGGGLYNANGSTPTLANCIVWGDIPDAIVDVTGASSTVRYSNVQGGWGGTGNINGNPLFADTPAADYRLSAGSPAIDAADNDSVPFGVALDVDLLSRFLDDPNTPDTGNGTPPIVDMGPYEFQITPPTPPNDLQASDSQFANRIEVTWAHATYTEEYRVYRHTDNDPNASSPISAWQPGTNFGDTTAVPEQVYWYWVKGRNGFGESDFSNGDSGMRFGIPIPPINLEASDGAYSSSVLVTWSRSELADDYQVYRSENNDPNGALPLGDWRAGHSFDDTTAAPKQAYWYWVQARNVNGRSDFSEGNTGYRRLAASCEFGWSRLGDGMTHKAFGGQVRDMVVFDDGTGPALYACGTFDSAGGVPVSNIAKWNGFEWSAVGGGIGGGGGLIRASIVTVFDDGAGEALYAFGVFDQAGGNPANGAAKWDGVAWSPLGQGLGGGNSGVYDATIFNDGTGPVLVVGGAFVLAGGEEVHGLAKWDGTTWSAVAPPLRTRRFSRTFVGGLAIYDDGQGPALFVGGVFETAGEVPAMNIAKWDGQEWSPLGDGMSGACGIPIYIPFVQDLAVYDDGSGPRLIAAGTFA
ncbi:MAG: hypothetical protein IID33_13325, partial [Planctomycetes bacterium]|nr:hypothetical protein [Planctomycetota bacterium]